MASSSWQRLGEGFASDCKTKRGISICEGSKGGKRTRKSHATQQITKAKWNSNDFFSSFSLPVKNDDSNSPQNDNISWSASSSDGEVQVENDKIQNELSYERERKRKYTKKSRTSSSKNKRPVHYALSQSLESEFCEAVDSKTQTCLKTKMKEVSKESGLICAQSLSVKKENVNVSKWSISTFDADKEFEASKSSSKKCRNIHAGEKVVNVKSFEDVDIGETVSSTDSEGLADEMPVEEKDMEDIVSDDSDDYIQHQKPLQTSPLSGSQFMSQEKGNDCVIEIGSITSSVGSGPSSQKVGASDWAVKFQQEVGEIDPDSKSKDMEGIKDDSAKKKHKFSSESLVGQLNRLINREKSAMRFWQHSLSKGTWNADNCQKSVTLEIVSMVQQFSIYLTHCQVISDSNMLLHAENCQLMLVRSQAEKMGIHAGSILLLFPPWKQLDEGEKIMILCANQMRVISSAKESASNRQVASTNLVGSISSTGHLATASNKEEMKEISFKWTCPCKHNLSLHSTRCPAHNSDHYINYFSQMSLFEKTNPSLHSTFHLNLHSVKSSALPPACNTSLSSAAWRPLLQSIQEERGEGIDCMPPFTATVLRVFQQNVPTRNSISLSVLLEDMTGTLALVQYEELDMASHKSLRQEIFHMGGKECVCQGLTMVTRRTKDRDPSLFQVISRVWKGGKPQAIGSQDNDSQMLPTARKIPSFCYILQCVGEASNCLQVVTGLQSTAGLDLTKLRQAAKNCQQRFSCAALVMDIQCSLSKPSCTSAFAYDPPNCDDERVTTFHPLVVDRRCVPLENSSTRKSQIYLLQDVVWDRDKILADEYSSLLSQSVWNELGMDKLIDSRLVGSITSHGISVPSLCHCKASDSFVKFSGHIVCINEDKCYSWEGCQECGTELMTPCDNGVSTCPTCNKEISQPETRLNMEVDILEDSCKDCIVRIDLTQSTISSLLPQEVPKEGYDMDIVLGKSVSGLAYIVDKTVKTIQLYQVEI